MHSTDQYFSYFKLSIEAYSLPKSFTFPFFYQPHPLCLLAAEQLQQYLISQKQWHHDFNATGKMFGVLLVQNEQQEIGFLSAFSGKVADQNLLPGFVPPVYDMLKKEGFFVQEFDRVTRVSKQAKVLEVNPEIADLSKKLSNEKKAFELDLDAQQQMMAISRKERKLLRQQSTCDLNLEQITTLNEKLAKQSISDKNTLRDLKQNWQHKIETINQQLTVLTDALEHLKELRKTLSAALQKKIFEQYRFLNIAGEQRDLNDIFKSLPLSIPPAGSGECAAPKLLQYAFIYGLKPLALAEFWWGSAPKSEVRQHGTFYPSCTSKCQPILGHMLKGIQLDDNPLLVNAAVDKEIEVIYQDEAMLVINKPNELLSVPGKSIKDSVLTRLRKQFPEATGPLIVHRLDMATSGLMLIALTQRANKSLTKQFRTRTVEKCYVALIEGKLQQAQGEISLPLRGDLFDRPRQLVCFEDGKPASTSWQVLEITDGRTKLSLNPKTGRTHQLRVHCAHAEGLGMPIVGDCLYGQSDSRLHLHAQSIRFLHPYTKAEMFFEIEADF
jgi:tRNA pseudouridine32 synthase/23S rRNA pseudouridine746 synthase